MYIAVKNEVIATGPNLSFSDWLKVKRAELQKRMEADIVTILVLPENLEKDKGE